MKFIREFIEQYSDLDRSIYYVSILNLIGGMIRNFIIRIVPSLCLNMNLTTDIISVLQILLFSSSFIGSLYAIFIIEKYGKKYIFNLSNIVSVRIIFFYYNSF